MQKIYADDILLLSASVELVTYKNAGSVLQNAGSAPLIRSRPWRYINLFTYLLTYRIGSGFDIILMPKNLLFCGW